jgi:anti-sigma factor RsiW
MPKLSCQEAQVLLEAFHDNELDSVSSLSVQEHLDDCPECRRHWRWLCEVEATLQRFNESVPAPSRDLPLRLLRHDVKQASPVMAFFRARRRLLTGVASLALLFALAAIIMLSERTGTDVMLFVRDSIKMAQSAAPVDLRTSSAEEAEQWLRQHIGLAPAVRCPAGFKLLGARSCRINNEPVGLLLFERDGRRLSCYVSRSSLTALHGYDGVTSEGIKLGTCEDRRVAAWDAESVSYLLVADLTKDAFLAVTNEIANYTPGSLKQ